MITNMPEILCMNFPLNYLENLFKPMKHKRFIGLPPYEMVYHGLHCYKIPMKKYF